MMQCNLEAPILNLLDLFNASMDRDVPPIFPIGASGEWLNLGAGEKKFTWANPLQPPEWVWDASHMPLPALDSSIDGIVAFHFFEHLPGDLIPDLLVECARVLKSGGTLTIGVPHRLGAMAWQDLDHKSFFTEETWPKLMANPYYVTKWKGGGVLRLHFNLIMSLNERNLMLLTQFVRL